MVLKECNVCGSYYGIVCYKEPSYIACLCFQIYQNIIKSKIGTPASVSIAGDISNLDVKIEAINTAIGYTGSSVYTDLGLIKAVVDDVKLQTDRLNFSGLNVLSEVALNTDKTGYFLDGTQLSIIVNDVWDSLATAHTGAGTFGKLLQDVAAGAIADCPISYRAEGAESLPA